MSEKPTLRSFQDIRDVASETIQQVRNRDITADQVKGIQGLLTLAVETIVKEEAINRALVANTGGVPGVPATTTPPPKGPKTTEGTFILNLNVNSQEPSRVIDVQAHSPVYEIDDTEDAPEPQPLDIRVLAGQQMTAARAATVDVKESNRNALLQRLRAPRG